MTYKNKLALALFCVGSWLGFCLLTLHSILGPVYTVKELACFYLVFVVIAVLFYRIGTLAEKSVLGVCMYRANETTDEPTNLPCGWPRA